MTYDDLFATSYADVTAGTSYEELRRRFPELPARTEPPSAFDDWSCRSVAAHLISASKRDGSIDPSFRLSDLVWTKRLLDDTGHPCRGMCFLLPGGPLIALKTDLVDRGVQLFKTLAHEVGHAVLGTVDEQAADRFAERRLAPALYRMNRELERAVPARPTRRIVHPNGGVRSGAVLFAGDQRTFEGRRQTVVWAGDRGVAA